MGIAFSDGSDYSFTAFKEDMGSVTLEHVAQSCPEGCWGRTIASNKIRFYGPSNNQLDPRLVVHEFGHAFNAGMANKLVLDSLFTPYSWLARTYQENPEFPHRNQVPNDYGGFAGPLLTWQQSMEVDISNEFADMFLGWTYGNYFNNTDKGLMRAHWTTDRMDWWLH